MAAGVIAPGGQQNSRARNSHRQMANFRGFSGIYGISGSRDRLRFQLTPPHPASPAAPRFPGSLPGRRTPRRRRPAHKATAHEETVLTPFPDIAEHVLEPPRIGRLLADWLWPAVRIVQMPGHLPRLAMPRG